MFSFFGNNDDDDNENNNNLRPPRRLERSGAYDWDGEDDDGFGPGRFGDDNRIDLDNGEGKISVQAASDANTPYVNLLGLTTSRDGEERRGAKPINIRNLRNEIISFDVDTSTKVLKLKQMYANRDGRMEPSQMRFIFQRRQLDDNKTLHHYGIKPGDEIHLVMRLRGGILGGGKKKKRKSRKSKKRRRKKSKKKRRKSRKSRRSRKRRR
tara:strand:- start:1063 stop:1692 length:630 start_codon:yes stop_codon:yes gene_type:complete